MRRFILQADDTRQRVRKYMNTVLDELPCDIAYDLELKKHTDKHSGEQERGFHLLRDIISDETGYDREEVKDLIKRNILGTRIIKIGNAESEVVCSSSKASKPDYSLLIEGAYRIASEAGIILPVLQR